MLNPSSNQYSSEFPMGSPADTRIRLKPSTLWAPPLTVSSAFSTSKGSTAAAAVEGSSVTPALTKQ
ncbi:hypothetical protein SKDZ_05G1620 [Saccharomyces kudriavzevii ZP591]|nr:hypothetical protein SKDZ_05G1620 [Saccharomyces kudriavzevii ZP591]